MLKAGDKAPAFRLKTEEGKVVSLADLQGKRVLLYFYPKANTPG
jgi:peroxiredoxin Q/BCP